MLERRVERCIWSTVSTDDKQFGFIPGKGTINDIFIVHQLQEKYLAKNRNLYLAFIDLEKAFYRVPHAVLWWAMRKVGVEGLASQSCATDVL